MPFPPSKTIDAATPVAVPTAERVRRLETLLGMLLPVPSAWLGEGSTEAGVVRPPPKELEPLECTSWDDLVTAWRKAMSWTPGLEKALATMLACSLSTPMVGEQLWALVISCASSGKTTLCEALSVAKQWVVSKDTFTGLVSGYQVDKEGSENLSLVGRLKGKTLLVNDADSLLRMPNLLQIMSQLRAFYGRNLRTSYNNKMSSDWEGIDTTVIFCGTGSVRRMDAAELGARFLVVSIMDGIDSDFERGVALRVAHRGFRSVKVKVNCRPESGQDKDVVLAKRLTGGYVAYLRERGERLLNRVETSDAEAEEVADYGEFVAYMRGRPSKEQEEVTERELSARLVEQYARLAVCLAAVTGKTSLDREVMDRVREIALDTAYGRTYLICRCLYDAAVSRPQVEDSLGRERYDGCETKAVSSTTGHGEERERVLLRYLQRIGAVETFSWRMPGGATSSRTKWALSPRLFQLFERVVGQKGGER